MRLSESLRKGVMESLHGSLVSRIGIKRSRRLTLFFGDIFINYLKECEKFGYRDEMFSVGRTWMSLYFHVLVPSVMKSLPLSLLNIAMRKVWVNAGLMDDFSMEKEGDSLIIRTKNEAISRHIGENGFSVGLYMGIVNSLFGEAEIAKVEQAIESNIYSFRITGRKFRSPEGKLKAEYDMLNKMKKMEGFTLSDAFRKKMLVLNEDNKIYFRERPLYPVENTVFHIIGNEGVLLEKVPEISCQFFSAVVDRDAPVEKRLLLLKTLLQVMGWGIIKMAVSEREIVVNIDSPPFGMQKEKENWEFLSSTILGYLWTIDKGFTVKTKYEGEKYITLAYVNIS
jgi:hypothetical protein